MAFTAGTIGLATDFIASSAGAGSSGKAAKLDANGKIDLSFLYNKPGGTGADGALTITSGTTTLDLTTLALFVKNYSSMSITGTAKLGFTNPNANGSMIYIKCQGTGTFTSSTSLDASGMGAAAGVIGSGNSLATVSTAGRTSVMSTTVPGTLASNNGAIAPALLGITNVRTIMMSCGSGGGGGGIYFGSSDGQGGGGGASFIASGSNGSNGGGNTSGVGAGPGGRGGGALYLEIGGAYTNTSSIMTVAGAAGTAATQSGSGGGGGGGGGTLYVFYNTLVSDTGTYTVSGGAAGSGNGAGNHAGGAGANGYSSVGLLTF